MANRVIWNDGYSKLAKERAKNKTRSKPKQRTHKKEESIARLDYSNLGSSLRLK